MPAPDLLVVGDCNPDLLLDGDVAPVFGQVETLIDAAELTIGGSAAIVACGAARLGLSAGLASLVGDDALARVQLAALAERGVDTSAVVVDPAVRTGLSVIARRGSDRAIMTALGAIGELRGKHVEGAVGSGARHMHLTPYFLLECLRPDAPRLLETARQAGATTSLDTNWDPSGVWTDGLDAALAHVDYFMPNAGEALRITGRETVREAAAALAVDIPTVVVKLGSDGAYARSGDQEASAAAPAVDVLDTIGAGDSFTAGFIAARLGGRDLTSALRTACACGSLSARGSGGVEAQPTMEEATASAGLSGA